jgi:hypothetical protein
VQRSSRSLRRRPRTLRDSSGHSPCPDGHLPRVVQAKLRRSQRSQKRTCPSCHAPRAMSNRGIARPLRSAAHMSVHGRLDRTLRNRKRFCLWVSRECSCVVLFIWKWSTGDMPQNCARISTGFLRKHCRQKNGAASLVARGRSAEGRRRAFAPRDQHPANSPLGFPLSRQLLRFGDPRAPRAGFGGASSSLGASRRPMAAHGLAARWASGWKFPRNPLPLVSDVMTTGPPALPLVPGTQRPRSSRMNIPYIFSGGALRMIRPVGQRRECRGRCGERRCGTYAPVGSAANYVRPASVRAAVQCLSLPCCGRAGRSRHRGADRRDARSR